MKCAPFERSVEDMDIPKSERDKWTKEEGTMNKVEQEGKNMIEAEENK